MSNIIIPSSPEDRKRILNAMKEYSNSLTRIEAERDQMKNIVDDLADEVDISKSVLKKLCTIYHKQNLAEQAAEMSDIETLYESVTSAS